MKPYPEHRSSKTWLLGVTLLLASVSPPAVAATWAEVQSRITQDLADGRPVVVHVTVALCDNANQGIVPVPRHLGNGQDPRSNLCWGAMYGVRTYFSRRAGWTAIPAEKRPTRGFLNESEVIRNRARLGTDLPVGRAAEGSKVSGHGPGSWP